MPHLKWGQRIQSPPPARPTFFPALLLPASNHPHCHAYLLLLTRKTPNLFIFSSLSFLT